MITDLCGPKEDEHPTYTFLRSMAHFTLPIKKGKTFERKLKELEVTVKLQGQNIA